MGGTTGKTSPSLFVGILKKFVAIPAVILAGKVANKSRIASGQCIAYFLSMAFKIQKKPKVAVEKHGNQLSSNKQPID